MLRTSTTKYLLLHYCREHVDHTRYLVGGSINIYLSLSIIIIPIFPLPTTPERVTPLRRSDRLADSDSMLSRSAASCVRHSAIDWAT